MTVAFDTDEKPADRAKYERVYMGEGIPDRCANCYAVKDQHSVEAGTDLFCYESFIRSAHGDR